MAFLERLPRVLVRMRDPSALVPQHHGAAAIFARGDSSFEVAVIEWVVLGPHGEALLVRVKARTLGDRPALQDSVELETEVPVEPRRIMLLDDEAVALALEL